MKTSELTGRKLDEWVFRAANPGLPADCDLAAIIAIDGGGTMGVPRYSTEWAHGGPIIEREKIELVLCCINKEDAWSANPGWSAPDSPDMDHRHVGPTPLIAAMRAYIASKYGGTVPDA